MARVERTSQHGIATMHYFEDCKLKAYPDPGSQNGEPWTIGRGHTGPEVCPGLRWSQEQADAAFVRDLQRFERDVLGMVKVTINQGQFDALVSFAYNLGSAALRNSTLLRKLNAGDVAGATLEFPKWNKNDGKVMRGLTRRRYAEQALFRGATSDQAICTGVVAA